MMIRLHGCTWKSFQEMTIQAGDSLVVIVGGGGSGGGGGWKKAQRNPSSGGMSKLGSIKARFFNWILLTDFSQLVSSYDQM